MKIEVSFADEALGGAWQAAEHLPMIVPEIPTWAVDIVLMVDLPPSLTADRKDSQADARN